MVSRRDPARQRRLIYLMAGKGRIRLNDRNRDVEKGAGVYLGCSEGASIRAADGAPLKLLHLVAPRIPK